MQEKFLPEEQPIADDEVSLKRSVIKFGNFRRYLASKWRLLILAAIVGTGVGLAYSFLTKPVYTAECTFVLQENDKSGGGLGQYSSLASMVGIDVGGSNSLFESDNISQLYVSRLMIEKTLLSAGIFHGINELLIDRYLEISHLREAWKDNKQLSNITFNNPEDHFSLLQDSVISLVVNDITKNHLTVTKPDKKLSMISVKVKSTDPLFAKMFTGRIVDNVNTFYIQTKTEGALKNVLLLQHQSDSVHHVLNSSIGRAAFAADANPNPDPAAAQTLRAPSQRRQVDVQASTAIYTEVTRNLEIARGALQRETPLIRVIDQPVLPLPVERAGKIKSALSGLFIAVLVMIIGLGTWKSYKKLMN